MSPNEVMPRKIVEGPTESSPLRVCFLYPAFFPQVGGVETRLFNLARALVTMGHEIHVVTRCGNGHTEDEIVDGIQIHRFNLPIAHRWPFTPSWPEKAAPNVSKVVNKYDVQVIDAQNCTALVAAMMAKSMNSNLRVVFSLHDVAFRWINSIMKMQLSFFINCINWDGMIVPSRTVASDVANLIQSKSKSVKVVWNGIDSEQFRPGLDGTKIRKEIGLTSRQKLIVCPTRLVPFKGLEFVIESLPLIRRHFDAKLLVTGNGSATWTRRSTSAYVSKLTSLAEELGVKDSVIFLHGRISYDSMPLVYAAADVVACASTVVEGFGMAAAEAFGCGRPVVTTPSGFVSDLVAEDCQALLVNPGDHVLIATQISRVLENKKLSARLGRNARELVLRHLRMESMAKNVLAVYRDCLKEN